MKSCLFHGDLERDIRYSEEVWIHQGSVYPYNLNVKDKNRIIGSACIKGSLGVRDFQKLPWDFQKSMPGLGLPTFKDN